MNVYSQGVSYSKILRNVNPDAEKLYHDLNASKDSLELRHDEEKILRVQFLSHKGNDKKKYDYGKSKVSVPLSNLGVGRYTVAIYIGNGQVIVHGLVRLLPIPTKDIRKDAEDLRIAKLKTSEKINVLKRVTKAAPVPKKEVAVAVVLEKKKTTRVISNPSKTKKAVASAKPKYKPSKTKKAVASAKPKRKVPSKPKGPTLAEKLRNRAKRNALAAVEAKKEEIRQRKLDKEIRDSAPENLNVTKVSYNLSNAESKTMSKQSRAEYRKNNLRPNGQPYDD